MQTFNFPSLLVPWPDQFDFSLLSNTQISQSPLSGSVQTLELPGARWGATLTFNNVPKDDAATLEAFLVQLRGQANRFRLWNYERPNVRGTGAGTPVVSGSGQTGYTLNTKNWNPGDTVLLPGDMIGINGELKMVTAAATADANGLAAVQFEPPLRASPGDGTAIITEQPTATFILTDPKPKWSTKSGPITNFAIDAVEVW